MNGTERANIPNAGKEKYTLDDLLEIETLLNEKGTFHFVTLDNGLFPASPDKSGDNKSGYGNVWFRDNVFVAFSHQVIGQTEIACNAAKTLMKFFANQKDRVLKVIQHDVDLSVPMNRAHIRFDGGNLEHLDEIWPHAQNDALGYLLWLYCNLVQEGSIQLTEEKAEVLSLFPRYFQAVKYWEDADNGHWEEELKVNASSIGVALGGLLALQSLTQSSLDVTIPFDLNELRQLIVEGQNALNHILPMETIYPESRKREYDSALLFLIYPMNVVTQSQADEIIERVQENLQGPIGIPRYQLDSFWCADYTKKLNQDDLTVDWSENQAERDALAVKGEEAQWCIFDPIISVIYGERYLASGNATDLAIQTKYFNRCLAQITSDFECPELYYLSEGEWIPNPSTPLLWTQANLRIALHYMKQSAAK